jgi:hypothetical protein
MNSQKVIVYSSTAFTLFFAVASSIFGQTPAVRPLGVISAIDADAKKLTLKTDAGPEMAVNLDDATAYLRVPVGEKSLAKAEKIEFKSLATGDRIIARGAVSPDQKSIKATQVIVMSKEDLAKKQEADRAEWSKRGITGTVAEVDAAKNTFTLKSGGMGTTKLTVVSLGEGARLRRYAHDSIKFNDAATGNFSDIKIGDQARALGEKSEDGAKFIAEEILSGTFRNIAAQVVSIDAAAGSMVVKDLDAKKNLTVKLSPDSSFKKLPERFAQMMAMRLSGGGRMMAAAGGARGGAGTPAAGGARGPGGPGAGGFGGAGGAMDPQQILDRLPQLTLAEIKNGDALMIASMAGTDAGSIVAITLIAGVEPIFTAAPQGNRQQMMGAWSLEVNMGGQ